MNSTIVKAVNEKKKFTGDRTDSLKVTLGPNSVSFKELKKNKNFTGNKIVFEFVRESISFLSFDLGLDTARSPTIATRKLRVMSEDLRNGKAVWLEDAALLADAIDRVVDNKNSVNFLYGPQKSGRPPKDRMVQFWIFLTIEVQHTKLGKLSSSRAKEGAFDSARKLLESDGIYLEVDELRRVRQEVIHKASEDPDYLYELCLYIQGKEYEMEISC